MLVYPDYKRGNKIKQGHIGIVVSTNGKSIKDVKEITHCSISNYQNFNDAIKITDIRSMVKT